jgi:hypothetical protein
MKLILALLMAVSVVSTAHADGSCGVYKSETLKTGFQIAQFDADFVFTRIDSNGARLEAINQETHRYDFLLEEDVTFIDGSEYTFRTSGEGRYWSVSDQNGNSSGLDAQTDACSF